MKDCRYEKPYFVISEDAINERTKYINLELNRRVESILNEIANETANEIVREHIDTKSEVKRLKKALNAVYVAQSVVVVSFIAFLMYIK